MGCLYVLDFPNGKKYIGITRKTLEERFVRHKRAATEDRYLIHKALRKHGDAVTCRALVVANDWDYLCLLEQRAIRAYGTFGEGGYNTTTGGEGFCGGRKSKEAIEKTASALRGKPRPPDVVARIADKLRGRSLSAETKAKMSATRKAHTPEMHRKRVEKLRGRKRPDIAVRQMLQGKGVSWDTSKNKWAAYVFVDGKKRHLGRFDSEEQALEVRKAKVLQILAEKKVSEPCPD